jgi:hypothetical protein
MSLKISEEYCVVIFFSLPVHFVGQGQEAVEEVKLKTLVPLSM